MVIDVHISEKERGGEDDEGRGRGEGVHERKRVWSFGKNRFVRLATKFTITGSRLMLYI